jgi:hypothetical protein
MKKLFFALMALTLAVVSCQKDVDYTGKDAVEISLNVDAPELGTTRGETGMNSGKGAIDNFSDDEWATYDLRYMLEIYDVTPGYENLTTPVKERMVQTFDSYQPTTFELRLVPNRVYKFVVWADFVLQGKNTDLHYNTASLRNITRRAKPSNSVMHECMDAYFIQKDIEIRNALTNSLTLTRPFGKVRVIAKDVHEVNNGTTPAKVDVTFYNHPTFVSLDALTGKAEKTVETVVYSYDITKEAPYSAGYDASEEYQTLFADYIFTDRDDAQEINFTMAVTDQNGRPVRSHDFNTQIPLKRNHLTTIIGNLLTTATEIEITIDDDFDTQEYVENAKTPLATPVIDVTLENKNDVTISWNDVELAESYTVVINDEVVDLTATRGETAAVNQYKFVGEYDTTYIIKVIATPAADTDYRASEATFEITTEAQETLATPVITATLTKKNDVTFAWEAVEKAESYIVTLNDEVVTPTANFEYSFVGEYEATYVIKVVATTTDEDYIASEATAEITTEAQETLATPVITATLANQNEVTFTWKAVEKAESYIVTLDGEEVTPTADFEYSFVGKYKTTYEIKVVATTTDEDYIASEATAEITTGAEYIYLDATKWEANNATYKVIVWKNIYDRNPATFGMTDSNNDGIYEVEKPEGYTHIKFSRTTPSSYGYGDYSIETNRVEIPKDGNNLFTITDAGSWNRNARGNWSKK